MLQNDFVSARARDFAQPPCPLFFLRIGRFKSPTWSLAWFFARRIRSEEPGPGWLLLIASLQSEAEIRSSICVRPISWVQQKVPPIRNSKEFEKDDPPNSFRGKFVIGGRHNFNGNMLFANIPSSYGEKLYCCLLNCLHITRHAVHFVSGQQLTASF